MKSSTVVMQASRESCLSGDMPLNNRSDLTNEQLKCIPWTVVE